MVTDHGSNSGDTGGVTNKACEDHRRAWKKKLSFRSSRHPSSLTDCKTSECGETKGPQTKRSRKSDFFVCLPFVTPVSGVLHSVTHTSSPVPFYLFLTPEVAFSSSPLFLSASSISRPFCLWSLRFPSLGGFETCYPRQFACALQIISQCILPLFSMGHLFFHYLGI